MRNSVLIVDDIEINRELLEEMLKDEYDVILAATGKEALSILDKKHEEIAVMLLDLVMPEMDGFQVIENVRVHAWGSQLPVIIISSEST